jgi:hypothetical protein
VEHLTGLLPQEFQKPVEMARLGHYLGEATLNSAGLDLLEALAEDIIRKSPGVTSVTNTIEVDIP